MTRKLNMQYRFNPKRFGSREHSYEVVGQLGGVHLHITEFQRDADLGLPPASGGLEFHYASCPPGEDRPPDHAPCNIIGRPCWHDGTSLYVSEVLLPFWELYKNDPETILTRVAQEYARLERRRQEGEP
jgi:hypothetical protein